MRAIEARKSVPIMRALGPTVDDPKETPDKQTLERELAILQDYIRYTDVPAQVKTDTRDSQVTGCEYRQRTISVGQKQHQANNNNLERETCQSSFEGKGTTKDCVQFSIISFRK
jgi:hypothetical protein